MIIAVEQVDQLLDRGDHLEHLLSLFVDEFNRKKHLSFLLFNKKFSVCFDCGSIEYGLNMDSHHISWYTRASNDREDVILSGNKEVLISLLSGEIPLRKAEKRGLLQVDAPFRTKLLLESIFLLTLVQDRAKLQTVGA